MSAANCSMGRLLAGHPSLRLPAVLSLFIPFLVAQAPACQVPLIPARAVPLVVASIAPSPEGLPRSLAPSAALLLRLGVREVAHQGRLW